jgi:hypothetical protein
VREKLTAHLRTLKLSFLPPLSLGGVGTDIVLAPPGERRSGVACISKNILVSTGAIADAGRAGVSPGSDAELSTDVNGRMRERRCSSSSFIVSDRSMTDAPKPRPSVAPAEERDDDDEWRRSESARRSVRLTAAIENVRETPAPVDEVDEIKMSSEMLVLVRLDSDSDSGWTEDVDTSSSEISVYMPVVSYAEYVEEGCPVEVGTVDDIGSLGRVCGSLRV